MDRRPFTLPLGARSRGPVGNTAVEAGGADIKSSNPHLTGREYIHIISCSLFLFHFCAALANEEEEQVRRGNVGFLMSFVTIV